ncbi:hypothetical protein Tco_0569566 [Tanacetum coccineum]
MNFTAIRVTYRRRMHPSEDDINKRRWSGRVNWHLVKEIKQGGSERRTAKATKNGGKPPTKRTAYCDLHGPPLAHEKTIPGEKKDHPSFSADEKIIVLAPSSCSGRTRKPIVIEARSRRDSYPLHVCRWRISLRDEKPIRKRKNRLLHMTLKDNLDIFPLEVDKLTGVSKGQGTIPKEEFTKLVEGKSEGGSTLPRLLLNPTWKSIEEREVLAVVEKEGYCWMTPLIEYLSKGTLPAETKKARAIKIKARQYTMINRVLYRKSFLEPWLRYVSPIQAEYIVKEIHEGSCSMQSGPRSLVAKAIRSGYYGPTMHKDARNIIRKYDDCKTHRPVPKNPYQKLTPITSLLPFYKWGIDISGPFPEAQGKSRNSYGTISYAGLDFQEKSYLATESISETTHSETGAISSIASKGEDNKNWVKEVPYVLWAHCIMIKTSNGDTLFSLTYGTKAVIPVKIGMPSLRCAEINQAEKDEGPLLNLDMLKEKRRRQQSVKPEAKPRWKRITMQESAA